MSRQFSVKINGCDFPIACGKGEEERIKTLATYVDEKAHDLVKKMGGRVNDLHIMALVSLVLADELTEALDENAALSEGRPISSGSEALNLDDPKFVKTLSLLASRMENIADTLEGPDNASSGATK